MGELTIRRPPQTRSRRKPKGSGHERRGDILAAAKQLFLMDGYARVTTRAIAQAVGLSQTGLYIYFASKEEILAAIGEATHTGLTEAFEGAVSGAASPSEKLIRLLRAYIEYGLDHPADYQLTFTVGPEAIAPIAKDFSKPIDGQGAGARSFNRFSQLIAEVAGPELLGGLPPLVVTQILWFLGHGAVSLLISRPNFPWADRETLVDGATAMVLKGLFADPADGRPIAR